MEELIAYKNIEESTECCWRILEPLWLELNFGKYIRRGSNDVPTVRCKPKVESRFHFVIVIVVSVTVMETSIT
uniref:Uncharacterized protein n=1 Tax=Tanacetum cinerariifolium TaxID=118510 RepID=A0A699IIN5_TANCI|nr:hypothetical protein [Tanacetum cinerariifolium]